MTPLPKRRLSTARQGNRRQSFKIGLAALSKCPNCAQPYRPHTVCAACGYYQGKQVLTIKPVKSKAE